MFSWLKRDKPQTLTEITVSNQTVIRVLALTVLSFMFVAAIQRASHAILLIFTALFLALALNGPVYWLSQRLPGRQKGSRSIATALSFLFVICFIFGFIASIVPPLSRQTTSFLSEAPQLVEDVRNENSSLGRFVRRYNLEEQVDKVSNQLSDRIDNITGTAVTTFTKFTGSIFAMLTVLVLAFMMLIEGPRWLRFGKQLIPEERRPHAKKLMHDMYRVVRGYVNGQVLLATIAALMIVVPLFILDISYPIALMVIVFFCGLIPMVGHMIGAAIVTTVALFHSVPAAVIILAYYILYQQIENYALQPKIQANSTNMSPLLVFMSLIIGVSFGGIFGGLVAIPVAGCLRIIVLDYLESQGILSHAEVEKATTFKD